MIASRQLQPSPKPTNIGTCQRGGGRQAGRPRDDDTRTKTKGQAGTHAVGDKPLEEPGQVCHHPAPTHLTTTSKKLRKHTPCSASCQWCFTTNPKQQNRTNNAGMTWPSEEEEINKGQHVCAEPAHRQHKEERHTMWTGGHSLSAEHNQRTTGIQQTTRITPHHTWMLETDTTNGHCPPGELGMVSRAGKKDGASRLG